MHDFITLPYRLERAPPPFEPNAIKYPESLVRHFLKEFTKRGDTVFDPFAGLGTTLFVAEGMNRIPYGIEHDSGRQQWVAGQLKHWTNLRHSDAAKIGSLGFPKMDFCITSPPYMPKHHRWNPLFAGNPAKSGYDVYLRRMAFIFGQMKTIMKHNAVFVLQADNLGGRVYTPLVRDLGLAAEKHFRLDNEIVIAWDHAPKNYSHTRCLIFRNALTKRVRVR
jgi:hypothetical protein